MFQLFKLGTLLLKGGTLTEDVQLQGAEEKIFGPWQYEVTGARGKLRIEGFHNLHFWSSVIKILELRTMRLAGRIVQMGRRRKRRRRRRMHTDNWC
jgi:hypothetical protein